MSITFFLRSAEKVYPPCPTCGGRMNYDPPADRDCRDESCEGYGPFPIENTPEMNLANVNAMALLREVLGYESPDYAGELDPEDVKLRLAMAPHRAHNAVRPDTVEGNVMSMGLDLARIERYCQQLSVIAEIAARRREPIHYG